MPRPMRCLMNTKNSLQKKHEKFLDRFFLGSWSFEPDCFLSWIPLDWVLYSPEQKIPVLPHLHEMIVTSNGVVQLSSHFLISRNRLNRNEILHDESDPLWKMIKKYSYYKIVNFKYSRNEDSFL